MLFNTRGSIRASETAENHSYITVKSQLNHSYITVISVSVTLYNAQQLISNSVESEALSMGLGRDEFIAVKVLSWN